MAAATREELQAAEETIHTAERNRAKALRAAEVFMGILNESYSEE